MSVDQSTNVEAKIKEVFNKVLDVGPEDIKPDVKLDESLGVDSTEMVEISVGIKKSFGIALADNELKKTHTFKEIVEIVRSKGAV